jgi:ectoine hydroxylase-related dioxygenase (phytanoyl-CoA dioxygenase family)
VNKIADADFTLQKDGAVRLRQAFDVVDWQDFLEQVKPGQAGERLTGETPIAGKLHSISALQKIITDILGAKAQPVRAILFDKSKDNNWALGWHQDRTIALKSRHNVSGFGPWSIKRGIIHAEPPFDFISRMMTIRMHFDDVCEGNAPLRFAPGSHLSGRVPIEDYSKVLKTCGEALSLATEGDIWIYHTAILHASDAAKKPLRRRVLQIDYSSDTLPAPLEWYGIS